jgi:hypothetical protein
LRSFLLRIESLPLPVALHFFSFSLLMGAARGPERERTRDLAQSPEGHSRINGRKSASYIGKNTTPAAGLSIVFLQMVALMTHILSATKVG